ncbi:FAD-dependent thymidylate synthase [Clostridium sp.]|uniref:FAD-dependent thymidylate synthase n=1 Tax=Clostridium sp. TaxID=1506 RepID=UPI0026017DB9|nr:FAD-dependent thymidylate synthase [Clostridium sp.]
MKIIKPYVILEDNINGEEILKKIEKIGRVCYKSENNISEESAEKFIGNIIKRGHESVIEHVSLSVRVICDRGVTHEIVRHRIASYSQESTRYCNYSSDKFGNELSFIKPCFWEETSESYKIWEKVMSQIEKDYITLIGNGAKPQEARSILPNSVKTEIVMTMNLREWRHFLKLRTSSAAHPQMREVAVIILNKFKKILPVIFDDININS